MLTRLRIRREIVDRRWTVLVGCEAPKEILRAAAAEFGEEI
jgi:hypothetical protein